MKTIEQKAKKVPAIRFASFDDEWVEKKLGDVASFSKGMGYSKGDLKENGTPIVLYGRLYTKYETIISDVDTFADAKSNSVYSKGGEVIVPGSGETAEDISIASVVKKSGVLLGGDLNVITPPKNLDSVFLAISISNGKPHSDMAKMAQGKSVVHLHNTDLAEINLPYPNIIEQQKISSFFSNIDSLVSLEQKKYDKLTQVKKSMLEKMFPKEGATVPEIRFTGFKGDWEERKLSQLVSYFSSNLTAKDVQENGIYDLYDANGVIGKINCFPRKKEYISVIKDGAGVGRIRKLPKNTLVIGTMGILESIDSDLNFVFAMLERFELGKQFTGSTIPHIYFKDYGEHLYVVPDYCEQQKIGSYFSHLDSLISLQQRKLDKLKNIKKSLLEKMFV